MGQFMEQLVKNATPRSLLLIVVNSLQSENLNRNDQTMLNMLYKELDRRLDLKFGRILLALSTQAELKAMLDKELPFFTEYVEEIDHCAYQNNCSGIRALINTLGE